VARKRKKRRGSRGSIANYKPPCNSESDRNEKEINFKFHGRKEKKFAGPISAYLEGIEFLPD